MAECNYVMTYLDQKNGEKATRHNQEFEAKGDDNAWEVAQGLIAKYQEGAEIAAVDKTYTLVDVQPL